MTKKTKKPSADSLEPKLAEGPFRNFIERSTDLFTVVDSDARFLYVNPMSEHYLGVSPRDCLARVAFDFVHEDDRADTEKEFENWIQSTEETVFEFENRQVNRATGEVFNMRWTTIPLLDEKGVARRLVSTARDVTDLRRIEAELSEKELRLSGVMSGLLDGLITMDQMGVIQGASDSCFGMFGYKPSELIGSNINMLMPEPHRSKHDEYLARYRKTGITKILNSTREFDVLHKRGHMIVCELSVARIDVPGNDEPILCGSFRDVTQRIIDQEALKQSERRFHAIFDQEFQYVGILDPKGIVLDVNQTALEAGRVRRSEVIGIPFADTAWWSRSAQDRDQLRAAIDKAGKGEFIRYEAEYVLMDGEFRSVDFSLKPIFTDDERVLFIIAEGRDITDLKRAQTRETSMLRALATIGESASILAHEIKNPITAINSALRAVADKLGEDEQNVLIDLSARMQKLEHLMRRTLSLAKPLDLHLAPQHPEHLFRDVASSLREEVHRTDSQLTVKVADKTPSVLADAGLIEEVFTNLVKNALEAAEEGGRVILSARPAGTDRVALVAEDNGPGIDETVRTSLFQPFVTTKSTGTGIGLAISKKIVEEHGGVIEIGTSELGGARFEVLLPVAPH